MFIYEVRRFNYDISYDHVQFVESEEMAKALVKYLNSQNLGEYDYRIIEVSED